MLKDQTLDGQDTDDRNDPEAPAAPLSNGGPPLNDSPRPWGDNGIGN